MSEPAPKPESPEPAVTFSISLEPNEAGRWLGRIAELPSVVADGDTMQAAATALLAALFAELELERQDTEALRLEVEAGLAAIDRGEGIPHEEAMRQLRERLERLGPRPQ